MKIKGNTQKACPGCGQPGWRRVDRVCGTCERELREGKEIKEKMQKDAEMEIFLFPWTYYALPYIQNVSHSPGKEGDLFRIQFYELLKILSAPCDMRSSCGNNQLIDNLQVAAGMQKNSGEVYMRKDVRDGLNELYRIVNDLVQAAYLEGEKTGHSLILGLASGAVSLEKFNEATIKGKK